MATGVEKVTCCQPERISPVNVAVASSVPSALHRCADVGAGVAGALVEPDAGDPSVGVGGEPDAHSTELGVVHVRDLRNGAVGPDRARARARGRLPRGFDDQVYAAAIVLPATSWRR